MVRPPSLPNSETSIKPSFNTSLYVIYVILFTASQSCHSGYEATVVPPKFPFLFCNPFDPDSRLTLPCEVTGPTAVQLDWYFNSSKLSLPVKLINGSKYLLQESVVQQNDLFISSLNISLIGLNASMDTGQYSCKAKSKENNFELIPQLNYTLSGLYFGSDPCDEIPIKNSDGGPCLQVIPIVLPSTTSSTSSSIYSIFSNTPSAMLSSFFMSSSTLYSPSISSTPTFPPFTNSSGTIYTNTLSSNTDERNTITSASTLTYITFPRTRITNTPSSVISTLSDITSSAMSSESNTNTPSNSMSSNGLQMTWLYLIFVIVILLFGVIVLSLVMIILCMLKSNRRVTMNVTPTLGE